MRSLLVVSAFLTTFNSLIAQQQIVEEDTVASRQKALLFTFSGFTLGGGLGGRILVGRSPQQSRKPLGSLLENEIQGNCTHNIDVRCYLNQLEHQILC
ncbi:MAG: hypothetical protein C4326_11175 [Ignavibacteria bacterium]